MIGGQATRTCTSLAPPRARIRFSSDALQKAYDEAKTPSDRVMLAFEGIMSHMPQANRHLIATKAATKHGGTLSQRLIELVRIRMAYWTQCRTCMTIRFEESLDDGLDQNAVCSLEQPQSTGHLSDKEKAAIAFADQFANDWLSIDNATFDGLRELFSEAEIVQLGLVCGLHLGTGRLMAAFAVTEDLPEAMQGESGVGKFKPWEVDIDALVLPPLPDEEDASSAVSGWNDQDKAGRKKAVGAA